MVDRKIIGERLRALRGNKSADIVCLALGISRSALGMYEAGERIPRDEIKVAIARYYKRTVQSIFFKQ